MKTCTQCKTMKPLDEFYRCKLTKDKRGSWCIACEKARNRKEYTEEYRKTESYLAAQRKYKQSDHGKSVVSKYTKWARCTRFEKVRAREAINAAIRHGRVVKPSKCSTCESGRNIHGHHEDYSRPLDVVWLCPRCHTARHKELADAQ